MDTFHAMTHYQSQRIRKHSEARKIPVTVVGGFLGSGKTTLVDRVAADATQERTDVLVREFGLTAIDDRLLHIDPRRIHGVPGISMHVDEQTMLYAAMERLHDERFGRFDRLLLETSGVDDPLFIAELFFLYDMPDLYELTNFVVLVDAEYGLLNLREYPAARRQIAFADTVLINKMDLAKADEVRQLERMVRKINPMARICFTTYGDAELSDLLDLGLYEQLCAVGDCSYVGREEAEPVMDIQSITLEESRPLDKEKVNRWISKLFNDYGAKLLRGKGFLCFADEDYRYEFQAVRKSFHSYANTKWQADEERKTVIVLIGERLPEKQRLQEELGECVKQ